MGDHIGDTLMFWFKPILFLAFFFNSSFAQEQVSLSKEEIANLFPEIDVSSVSDSPISGIYEVAVNSSVAYITHDGRYVFQGELFDLHFNMNLTETKREMVRSDLISAVNQDQAIIFSPAMEKIKHTITIFTDLDCGYCRKFHEEINEVNDLGIKVQYLFYPRTGPDTDSWYKAEKVWCSGTAERNMLLTKAKLGESLQLESCDRSPVSNHYQLGRKIGVMGTPAIYSSSGAHLGGYLSPVELITKLETLSYD